MAAADNADVDRLFGLVGASDDDSTAASFSSAASSSSSASSSSTSSSDADGLSHASPSAADADPLDAHLELTKAYHSKRRRDEAVNSPHAQPHARPRLFGPPTVLLNKSAHTHPLFTAKPRQTATAATRTLSTSPQPPPSPPPAAAASTSSVSSPQRLLTDEQIQTALTPAAYYSRQGVQDFDQVMSGSRSHVSAYVDLSDVAESDEYVRVPSFALGDGGVHGPHVSDHSVHKARHDGYWEERLRKLDAQQPREQYFSNLPAFSAHFTPDPTDSSPTPPSAPSAPAASHPAIFAGCLIYIDGRTEGASHLSAHSLTALIRLHGGRTSPLLSRTHTTHVLATNLTLSKHAREMRRLVGVGRAGRGGVGGGGGVVVVRPEWVRECIRCGRLLDEWPWRVVKDGRQRELTWSTTGGEESGQPPADD